MTIDKKHKPIQVSQPDGTKLSSTNSGYLNLPDLPMAACHAHVLPNLTVGLAGIPQLCDNNIDVKFTKNDIQLFNHGTANLIASHPRTSHLWTLPIEPIATKTSQTAVKPHFNSTIARANVDHTVYNMFPVPRTEAGKCLFHQQCLLSPTKSNLVRAAVNGYLTKVFPILTPDFLRKNYVDTLATAQAYLQRNRQHVTAKGLFTRPKPPISPSPNSPVQLTVLQISKAVPPKTRSNSSDTTANYPKTNIHFLVMFAEQLNYVKVIALKDHTGPTYLRAYKEAIAQFENTNPNVSYCPTMEFMDNVLFTEHRDYLRKKGIEVQLVPPGSHRANKAERAIQSFKKTLIAALATADPDFPIDALYYIDEHLEICINLLRQSHENRLLSAWEQLNGIPYDINRWPLIPFGAKGLVYENAADRPLGTFGPHGVVGFYIGTSHDHFGCYKMYIPQTKAVRITNSVYWLPHNPSYPRYERLPMNIYTQDSTSIPTGPEPFTLASQPAHIRDDTIAAPPGLPSPAQPSAPNALPLPVSEGANTRTNPTAAPPSSKTPSSPPPVTVSEGARHYSTPPPTPRHRQPSRRQEQTPLSRPATPLPAAPSMPVNTPTQSHQPVATPTAPSRTPRHRGGKSHKPSHYALYAHYQKTIRGPDLPRWHASMDREIAKLHDTFNGIRVVPLSSVPPAKHTCPFLNPVTRVKTDLITGAELDLRTRLTMGKQWHDLDPDANSSSVASAAVVKLLFNSTVSNPKAKLASIDLDYFYYQTRLKQPDYARLHVRILPMASRIKLGIAHLLDSDIIFLEISIALPGRPDAGKLAQQDLLAHLRPFGYSMCPNTPCLFQHDAHKDLRFATHVDDLIIKYEHDSTLAHLQASLQKKYTIKLEPTATKHLGMRIHLHRDASNPANDYLELSIPNGVRDALKKLHFVPTGNPGSPMVYTPPTYTSADQQERTDDSPPASAEERTYLQKCVGYFRYYAPAIDITLLAAVGQLSLQQANPTKNTMIALQRFLNYAYHHSNAVLTYRPSDMVLWIHSDASHHSEPQCRSRTGIYMQCGKPIFNGTAEPYTVNGAIDVISIILARVTGSTSESEYATLYEAAVAATPHRATLGDLGHPQPPTPIIYDNQVAGRIANNTAKLKRTRAIAKCYHWIRDRIAHKEFTLTWAPGKTNLGDFFTKAHPVHHFKAMRPVYVTDTISQ
jgi:hypothetical protein